MGVVERETKRAKVRDLGSRRPLRRPRTRARDVAPGCSLSRSRSRACAPALPTLRRLRALPRCALLRTRFRSGCNLEVRRRGFPWRRPGLRLDRVPASFLALLCECTLLRGLENAFALPLAARDLVVASHVDVFAHQQVLMNRHRKSDARRRLAFPSGNGQRSEWIGRELPDKYYGEEWSRQTKSRSTTKTFQKSRG